MPSILIAFSTASTARAADTDRTAATGPYAKVLAANLVRPGVDVRRLFDEVKFGVIERTGQKQVPWVEDGLTRRLVLVKGVPSGTSSSVATDARSPALETASTIEGRRFAIDCHDCPLVKTILVSGAPVAFAILEVTVADWNRCARAGPCESATGESGELPVTRVSWVGANRYVSWLNDATGGHFRLPTVNEWLAAEALDKHGPAAPYHRLREVGSKGARSTGLADLGGNVAEWTQTCPNHRDDAACYMHVAAGSSWRDPAKSRLQPINLNNEATGDALGFRVVNQE